MVGMEGIQVVDLGGGKSQNPIHYGYTPIQADPNIMNTGSPIAPCKGVTIKAQVLQPTIIQCISK